MTAFRLHCPAKINLHLQVLRRRPDGYHEIRTLMLPVGLFDEIFLEFGGQGIHLECIPPVLPAGPDNLAWQAAELYQRETGDVFGLRMVLHKRIPTAAGLGGGSSDAAGVLLALDRKRKAVDSPAHLSRMAARLGADVPFFLLGGPAVATGIGEKLRPVRIFPELYFVLISPDFPVSTKWAYENLDLGLTKGQKKNKIPALIRREEEIVGLLHNDLERVTARYHPWILRTKERLLELGAKGALMSGSGPTVFGVYTEEAAARSSFEAIREDVGSGVWWAKGASGFPSIQESRRG